MTTPGRAKRKRPHGGTAPYGLLLAGFTGGRLANRPPMSPRISIHYNAATRQKGDQIEASTAVPHVPGNPPKTIRRRRSSASRMHLMPLQAAPTASTA